MQFKLWEQYWEGKEFNELNPHWMKLKHLFTVDLSENGPVYWMHLGQCEHQLIAAIYARLKWLKWPSQTLLHLNYLQREKMQLKKLNLGIIKRVVHKIKHKNYMLNSTWNTVNGSIFQLFKNVKIVFDMKCHQRKTGAHVEHVPSILKVVTELFC